jgi:hypothetical protein
MEPVAKLSCSLPLTCNLARSQVKCLPAGATLSLNGAPGRPRGHAVVGPRPELAARACGAAAESSFVSLISHRSEESRLQYLVILTVRSLLNNAAVFRTVLARAIAKMTG